MRLATLTPILALAATAPLSAQNASGAAARTLTAPARQAEASLDIGGYASFRGEWSSSDDVARSLTLRRFVLTADARPADALQVYAEIELERFSRLELERSSASSGEGLVLEEAVEGGDGSELALEQAWAQLRVAAGLSVRLGAVLTPVGRFNLHHDDNLWDIPRRPLVDRGSGVLPANAAWTEMGLGVDGETYVGGSWKVAYQAYVLNGVSLVSSFERKLETGADGHTVALEMELRPGAGAVDGSRSAGALAGRLEVSPGLGSALAVSGYRGGYTPRWLEASGALTVLAIDARQRLGSVALEGEGMVTRYANAGGVARSLTAVVVDDAVRSTGGSLVSEAEVELHGLADRRAGFWLAVHRPVALPAGWWGLAEAVLVPTARYERVWVAGEVGDLAFTGGTVTSLEAEDREQERFAVGLGFRPVPQAVVQVAFEHNRAVRGALLDPDVADRATRALVLGLAVGF